MMAVAVACFGWNRCVRQDGTIGNTANQEIVSAASFHHVIAGTAGQYVGRTCTTQPIVIGKAVDHIPECSSAEFVVFSVPLDEIGYIQPEGAGCAVA